MFETIKGQLCHWRAATAAGIVAFGLFQAPAHAQEQRRVALVIGNGAYEYAPALENPVNDAVDIATRLDALGFEVIDGYDLEFGKMQELVRDYARALEGAEVGLYFYAGHGLQVDGRNYMVPVDATLSDEGAVDFEAIDMNLVLDQLAREPGRTSLVFLDACRDNPLASNLARQAAAARSIAMGQGLAQLESVAVGTLIAYSTQPGATAADGTGRNSPFTDAILHHLETPGLEVQQLMRRVRQTVVDGSDGLQVPWDNSSLTEDFYFVALPPDLVEPPSIDLWTPPVYEPSERQLDADLWNDVKDTGSVEELASYLDAFPNGIFAATARARIERLQREATAQADQAAEFAAAIASEFAALTGRGNIVENPAEPLDFYANARLYELRGDFLNARRSYLGYLNFELPYVDPHLRFQTFLRVQEGRVGAREVYNELAAQHPNDAVRAFAVALLYDAPQRIERIEAHLEAHPDFAPGYYELSRDFSLARLGSQTLADQRREKELLERFVELEVEGQLLKHYIDQGLAAEQLEDARTRLASLNATLPGAVAANPVSFTASRNNSGWTISFAIPEATREIFFSADGGDFVSTGHFPNVDQRTGAPMARPFAELPPEAGAQELAVRYTDASGAEQGPYAYAFNPMGALVEGQITTLQTITNGWVSHRTDPDYPYTYFTTLVSYRCGISEVRYGWDDETPDAVFALPACDPANPNTVPTDDPLWIDTDKGAEALYVQITYANGETSAVQRFAVPR